MSESAQHQQLVNGLISVVTRIVGSDNRCFIFSDAANGSALPPLTNEGYRPDVFYENKDMLIIGEAKTSNDIARLHSILQYESYIQKCSIFSGQALLIIMVPWMDRATANNIVKKIGKRYSGEYTIRILDDISGAK